MKIHIVIPTFNRSAKLYRLLSSYSTWRKPPHIHLIDSSDGNHLKSNKDLCNSFDFVDHYCYSSSLSFSPRLYSWLGKTLIMMIFFFGNDEDFFLRNIVKKHAIMVSNPKVSGYWFHITSLTPFLGFQVSLRRIVPFNYSISGSIADKISTFMALNSTARLPPCFSVLEESLSYFIYFH